MASHSNHKRWDYKQIMEQFRVCLSSLNLEYRSYANKNEHFKKALFAKGTVKVLLQHANILKFLDRLSKKDLIDLLATHKNKYIEILRQENVDPEIILAFQADIKSLTFHLGSRTSYISKKLTKEELDTVRNNVKNLVCKCQSLLTEQSYNEQIIDTLQASEIVYSITFLSVIQQNQLFDKLLLIKELWQSNNNAEADKDNLKLLSYLDPRQALYGYEMQGTNCIFDQIIKFFTDNNQVLERLTNEQLINLYDRLKNFDLESESIINLLQRIHIEAQYRYTNNGVNYSEIELLKRFQNFDNIYHQIENSEYTLTESFLIKRNIFIQETLIFIAKHADNIRAVGAIKSPLLSDILTKIECEFSTDDPNDSGSASIAIMLSLIKSKFLSDTEPHSFRRYAELDKFSINSLKIKYISLFAKIKNLIYKIDGSKEFLQSTIVRKLSQELYTFSVTRSTNKLRLLFKERKEVAKQLSEINFVEVFNHSNTISPSSRLLLRKLITVDDAKTVTNYVYSIIKILVANCNITQLEVLGKTVLQTKLSPTRAILKQEIINKIKQSTSFMQKLFYILTGQRSNFNKLKTLEDNLKGLKITGGEKEIGPRNTNTVSATIKNGVDEICERQHKGFLNDSLDNFEKKMSKQKLKKKTIFNIMVFNNGLLKCNIKFSYVAV